MRYSNSCKTCNESFPLGPCSQSISKGHSSMLHLGNDFYLKRQQIGPFRQIYANSVYSINTEQNLTIILSKMPKARQPCRQLNSQLIRGTALCYISPRVVGKCSIISAKCTLDVKERNVDRAWRSIVCTRDSCDEAVKGNFNLNIKEMTYCLVLIQFSIFSYKKCGNLQRHFQFRNQRDPN